jgi:hypothetical protein
LAYRAEELFAERERRGLYFIKVDGMAEATHFNLTVADAYN